MVSLGLLVYQSLLLVPLVGLEMVVENWLEVEFWWEQEEDLHSWLLPPQPGPWAVAGQG